MSLNVSPGFPVHDEANSTLRNVKLFGEGDCGHPLTSINFSNFKNKIISQLSCWRELSWARFSEVRISSSPSWVDWCSALRSHVIQIHLLCTQKQMRWINAISNVTSMANQKAFKNDWLVKNLPCKPMRRHESAASPEPSVTIGAISVKQPAGIGFSDLIQESMNWLHANLMRGGSK